MKARTADQLGENEMRNPERKEGRERRKIKWKIKRGSDGYAITIQRRWRKRIYPENESVEGVFSKNLQFRA